MAGDSREFASPEEVRDQLRQAAGELRAFAERMRALAGELAGELPPGSDEELEEEESLERELLGMLECLLADDLDPAIQKLEGVDELGAGGTLKR